MEDYTLNIPAFDSLSPTEAEAIVDDLTTLQRQAKTKYVRDTLLYHLAKIAKRCDPLPICKAEKEEAARKGEEPPVVDAAASVAKIVEVAKANGWTPPPGSPAEWTAAALAEDGALRQPPKPPGKFERYSWDQSDACVTIYIPVEAPTPEETTVQFGERSFSVIHCRNGEAKTLSVPNLCKAIDTEKSKVVYKKDMLRLKMYKVAQRDAWSALDDTKDRKKAERDKRVATGDLAGASTQQLLADMYQNATDEERASLKQAMAEGQAKREARARGELVDGTSR
mmetsp:Transcript_29297/g.87636  ORF Transcript_29297/g.87636 Transcript_29297/m.87636 type:complete len:282 (+) Transcript_29297:379-1224(+)